MKKILLLLFITIFIYGCGEEKKAEEKPPFVRTLVVGEATSLSEKCYTGKVVSRHETPLSFQVSGEINGRFVEQGAFVRAGQLLMTISQRDTAASLESASAEVAAKQAEASLATVNLKRYEELYAADAAPKSMLDEARTKANATAAALNVAEANLTRARNSNSYTNLTAPIDGVITSVTGERGQVVAAGSHVMTIADHNALEVEIDLPETEFSNFREGMTAEAEFYGINGRFPATIREITPSANPQSRTYRARLALSAIPENLPLGWSTKITFENKIAAVQIPLSAIDGEGEDVFCWVVEDNRVHKRPLKIKAGENNTANVNLPAGTAVVTAGIHLLKEGMEVRRDDVK